MVTWTTGRLLYRRSYRRVAHALNRAEGQRILLLCLLLASFAWRLQNLTTHGLWRDEIDAVYFAVRPLGETLRMFVDPAQNGPLYFLALRPWFRLMGTDAFTLRYPSVLAGVLAIALLWPIVRLLLPRPPPSRGVGTAAWFALGGLAANPYQLWYSQEGKMYALVVCLALLSSWAWLEGIRRGGWRPWLAYLLATSTAFYVHLLLIVLLPLHAAWFLLLAPRSLARRRGYLSALAGLTLPYLPMVWWQWNFLTRSDYTTAFDFVPLSSMVRLLLINQSRGFLLDLPWGWLLPILLLLTAGLLLGRGELARGAVDDTALVSRYGSWPLQGILVSWLLLPILVLYAISLIKPVFLDRYLIWVAPALTMLMGLGLSALGRQLARLVGLGPGAVRAISLLLAVWVLATWLLLGWQQSQRSLKPDLRAAVTYLASRRQADELLIVQIPHMEYSYRYYTSDFGPDPFCGSDARLAPWQPGLWTNSRSSSVVAQIEVERAMTQMVAGYDRVWLLSSEAALWDERGLMSDWLATHGRLLSQREWTGVSVQEYEMTGGRTS